MVAVNLAGFFHLTQKVAARMLQTGSGHIVNITATIAELSERLGQAGLPGPVLVMIRNTVSAAVGAALRRSNAMG